MGVIITTEYQYNNSTPVFSAKSAENTTAVSTELQDELTNSVNLPDENLVQLSSNSKETAPQETKQQKINQLNNKLKNLTPEQVELETINTNPYNEKTGKDAFGLTDSDYQLLCSVNPRLTKDIIDEFGARAAYYTDRSLNNLSADMQQDGFKKTGSQAETEISDNNPYRYNEGQDKFGKTEEDYEKMLGEKYSKEELNNMKEKNGTFRRAYFADVKYEETNNNKIISPLKEVNSREDEEFEDKNPYRFENGQDKFGKTEKDYEKMLAKVYKKERLENIRKNNESFRQYYFGYVHYMKVKKGTIIPPLEIVHQ